MSNKRGKRKRQDAEKTQEPEVGTIERKRVNKRKHHATFDQEQYDRLSALCMVHPSQFPPKMWKYWKHRYQLFSMYDEGCLLDEQSWYSVTPECVAYRIARRCATDGIVLDLFAGAGGNAIQFAFTCARVIAVEIDPIKIQLARWNAQVYGVADRIHFIQADAIQLIKALSLAKLDKDPEDDAIIYDTLTYKDLSAIEAIFLSPPWGGIDYIGRPSTTTSGSPPHTQSETEVDAQTNVDPPPPPSSPPPDAAPAKATPFYSLSSIVPIPGTELFEHCQGVTSNIAFYLPRNADMQDLAHLASMITTKDAQPSPVKVEEQWIGRAKLSSITAYYGQLATGWDDEVDDWKANHQSPAQSAAN